ncbi:MAG: hypothetical protein IKF71_03390 [Bacilli bacterium]|nr:hypothetical protein [Bacilli bacterium]
MEFKVYYYKDENKCIICKKENNFPAFESVNNKDNIIIDLDTKNVENIYDFFRDNVLKSILSEGENISIDFSDIENQPFYSEDSFAKLILLIDELKSKSNESINECFILEPTTVENNDSNQQ